MAWVLAGDTIPAPQNKRIERSAITVTHRTLDGGFTRDFLGSEKDIISGDYDPISRADAETIIAHWEDQQQNGTTKSLVITEDGFTFSGNVHINISPSAFPIANSYDYQTLSVIFTEV